MTQYEAIVTFVYSNGNEKIVKHKIPAPTKNIALAMIYAKLEFSKNKSYKVGNMVFSMNDLQKVSVELNELP